LVEPAVPSFALPGDDSTYSELHAAAREVDPVTDRLVVALLNEAVAGEEQMERLLADDEPDMSGG